MHNSKILLQKTLIYYYIKILLRYVEQAALKNQLPQKFPLHTETYKRTEK